MSYYYEINNDGDYELYSNGELIYNVGKEVSISYSFEKEDGVVRSVLYKHGSPKLVKLCHDDYLNKLKEANKDNESSVIDEMIKAQYLMTGRFDLEELNKCLSICDYIGSLHQQVFKIND